MRENIALIYFQHQLPVQKLAALKQQKTSIRTTIKYSGKIHFVTSLILQRQVKLIHPCNVRNVIMYMYINLTWTTHVKLASSSQSSTTIFSSPRSLQWRYMYNKYNLRSRWIYRLHGKTYTNLCYVITHLRMLSINLYKLPVTHDCI